MILQSQTLNRQLATELHGVNNSSSWHTMSELDIYANNQASSLRRRKSLASKIGGTARFGEFVDRFVRTDKLENIDKPDYPETKKHEIIRALHLQNLLIGAYEVFINLLLPHVELVNRSENRAARVLELGRGSGDFAI